MRWSVSASARAASEYARTIGSYPRRHWPFAERLPSVETDLARLLGAKPPRTNHYVAAGAGAVVVLGLAGLAVFLGITLAGSHPSRSCGLVKCHTALPAAAFRTHPAPSRFPSPTTSSVPPSRTRHRHHARRQFTTPSARPPGRTRPSPDPSPSRVPPPPPPPPRKLVAVHYQVTWGGPSYNAFRAQFTLVNHGGSPVSRWSLAAYFGGDHVQWVYVDFPGGGSGPFSSWQDHGGRLTLKAGQSSETIPPGGSETVFFQAAGGQVSPGSCDFNGAHC